MAMMQVSLIAYLTAGAFLGLAYFDYFYNLVADRRGQRTGMILVSDKAARTAPQVVGPAEAVARPRGVVTQRTG